MNQPIDSEVVEKTEIIPDAILQARALAELPPNLAMIRMENDQIFSLAAAHPRNHEAIKADIVAQLMAYPSFAQAAVYQKPVGTKPATCRKCQTEMSVKKGDPPPKQCAKPGCESTSIDPGGMQYASGLSIRAAEALAAAYGFNSIEADEEIIDDDHVKVTATFIDYQRGRRWKDSGIVSKVFRGAGGTMRRHSDDRFHSIVIKAEKSRRIREVVSRSVPPGLREELLICARRQAMTLLTDEVVEQIVNYFAGKGVTLEQVESHLGKYRKDWTKDDRATLAAIKTAVEDGDTSIWEVFERDDQPGNGGSKQPPGDVKPESFENPKNGGTTPGRSIMWKCFTCTFEFTSDTQPKGCPECGEIDCRVAAADSKTPVDSSDASAPSGGDRVETAAQEPERVAISLGSQPPVFPTKKQFVKDAARLVRLGLPQFEIDGKLKAVEYIAEYGRLWRLVSGATEPSAPERQADPDASSQASEQTAETPDAGHTTDVARERADDAKAQSDNDRFWEEIGESNTGHQLDHIADMAYESFGSTEMRSIDGPEHTAIITAIAARRGDLLAAESPKGTSDLADIAAFREAIKTASKSQLQTIQQETNRALQDNRLDMLGFTEAMTLIDKRKKALR